MGKALCVIAEFEPFGAKAEASDADDEECSSKGSYFLFDPLVVRNSSSNGVEEEVMSTSCSGHEEEIFLRDNVIVWSAGHKVRKRFSAPSTCLKACWSSMDSIPEPVLCVLHSASLSTYTQSGEVNSVPLPVAMVSMWPLPSGLLLQRASGRSSFIAPATFLAVRGREVSRAGKSFSSSRRSSILSSSESVYFTLQHHLEEPQALEFDDAGRLRPLTDWDEQVIWTCPDVPYVATYHTGRKQHCLWELKSSSSSNLHRTEEKSNSIFLMRRWLETVGQPQASEIFAASDEDGEPLLCFLVKDAKKLFSLRLPSACGETVIDIAWTIAAISAVPVVATRQSQQHCDLLVLAPDANLFLYTGRYPLCTFHLPASVTEPGITTQVVQLLDAVNDRVNVMTSAGQVYRCSVKLTPSSGITRSCLLALSEGLRPSFYRFILSSFLERGSSISEDLSGIDSDAEWFAFTEVIMKWVGEHKSSPASAAPLQPWDFLLKSSLHKQVVLSHCYPGLLLRGDSQEWSPFFSSCNKSEASRYSSMLLEILETLHMVYEDYKLDTLRWRDLWKLGVLLNNVAISIGEYDYADQYFRDFPTVVPSWQRSPGSKPNSLPPSHYTRIEAILTRKVTRQNLHNLLTNDGTRSLEWSRKVLGFFEVLLGSDGEGRRLASGLNIKVAKGTANNTEQRTVLAMVAEGFSLTDLDRLPSGVSLSLRHALNNCRESPPADWPSQAYILVGREDLAYTSAGRVASERELLKTDNVRMAAPYMLHLRPIVPIIETHDLYSGDGRSGTHLEGQASDGMEHMFNGLSSLRFGSDLRLNEVRRLLCSSKSVAVRTANAPDVSDPDVVALQQTQLWELAQRTTALSFGRGAFTLSTLRPLLTEALPIPKLVLSGRLPSQHDATVNLDVNAGSIADLTSWPEFHNGVAAGMRLAPGQAKITRTWIVYNKPDEPSYEHAGFLMSLGLHKHLAVLGATDVFRYLAQEHDPTTVGILLGMAAAHRGSMDPAISKMLYLHIPARHPPSFPELELSSLLQSAALMAVGLLYQASAHRLTTEILLAEIGRKPGNDSSLEREGYALAAGLALGLVTLGRGKEAWGLADLMIEDRLRYYMCGGSAVTEDHRWRFNAAGSYHHFQQKNLEDGSQTGGQVMEGSNVNLDVTAPGATLALGLMFMKTNDEAVAARLAIPDTHFALEYVRPDFILLRLVARSLILWDSVEASEHWIQSQIPSIVRQATARSVQSAEMEESLAYADLEALAQAHVNILAGACLSIGLRYAGTANAEAQQLLYHYALYFLKERKSSALAAAVGSGNDRVDCGTLETCLDIAVLSLAVVMAGTGHLETFKLLRYLRRRNETDGSTVYGNHMAISMAIGFLFLGGGLLTFSTDNGAVAALLISLYPRFPTSTNDHRCHLQAFRHLYVLATEPRCVQTLDVDTGLSVYVPLELTMRETKHFQETSFCRVSPCILPERSALKRLRVCGPRYWPQDIQFPPRGRTSGSETGLQDQDLFDSGMLYLYVKRKVGARSYADDPIGSRSLLSRALHRVSHVDNETTNTSDQSKVDELVSTFSSDPSLLAFAQLFCNLSGSNSTDGEFEEFCSSSLFECVSMDRPGLLQTYLSLYACVEAFVNIATGQGSSESTALNISLSLQSLKASLAYCEAAGHGHEAALKGQSLIQRTFLASLSKRVDDVLNEWSKASTTTTSQLVSYVKCSFVQGQGEEGDMNSDRRLMKALYLSWNSVPHPSLLNAALQKLCQVFRDPYGEGTNTVLPVLASLLPGTPTKTLLRISECVSFLRA